MGTLEALYLLLLTVALGLQLFDGWPFERRGRVLLVALVLCGVLLAAAMQALGRAASVSGQVMAALGELLATQGAMGSLMLLWRETRRPRRSPVRDAPAAQEPVDHG